MSIPTIELQEYGKKIIVDHDLVKKRFVGKVEKYDKFTPQVLINIISEFSYFSLDDVTYYIKNIYHDTDSFIDWKCDNARIMNIFRDSKDLINEDKITYTEQSPFYTLIIYENDSGPDFEGGLLEFADNTMIIPEKGKYIIFDSRDVYRTNNVRCGMSKFILINFYK